VSTKALLTNRKARRDYVILETLETGIALKGSEVKSLRQGKGSFSDSYASLEKGEIWLHNLHITPYDSGSIFNPPPKRSRKLLLHRREIKRLIGQTAIKGHTLVPLRLYLKHRLVKVELAVARGKKHYDKRETIKKREAERELARMRKYRNR
jgi:SsrA-binding protein